ncbi:MAG: peptide-methionine (S)-S-oxide reductase MsrA [Planctomycetota bacterium]
MYSNLLKGVVCLAFFGSFCGFGCGENQTYPVSQTKFDKNQSEKTDQESSSNLDQKNMAVATFGGGCFWCTEAVFQELAGVQSVESGYMGGNVDNPTYKQVCTGLTGHAEVIQIKYDPEVVSFDVLLQVFWKTHDPTTLNRQGNDVGTQYRSVVFYHDDEQKELATKYKNKLNEEKAFANPVVTEISPASTYYPAEDYHQNYFANNPNQPYCRALIPPKLEKLKKVFGDKLKK